MPREPRSWPRWTVAVFGVGVVLVGLGLVRLWLGPAHYLPMSTKSLYSQRNEEVIIRDFFRDRRGGFFVDVGSAHYQRHSTTYYLEKHLGWSGIAIDALPDWKEGYANRPATRFFNYIVTDHSGTLEKFYRANTRELSSTQLGRLARGAAPIRTDKVYEIPSITLNELLEAEGVKEIDFLSMDIEGGAPGALAGFDIGRFHPELVCIELGDLPQREEITRYFEENGYELTKPGWHDWVNSYFRRKNG